MLCLTVVRGDRNESLSINPAPFEEGYVASVFERTRACPRLRG